MLNARSLQLVFGFLCVLIVVHTIESYVIRLKHQSSQSRVR